MITEKFYEFLHSNNLHHNFYQFDNKVMAFQYVVPHEKTIQNRDEMDKVLDWGCAAGHFSSFLDYLGFSVTGYSFDGFPEGLKNSSNFSYKPAPKNEPIKIDFPDDNFDAVFSIGVLEHVHETGGDQLKSLKEIRRILRKNGKFYCFHLPNKYSWVEAFISVIYKITAIRDSAPHSRKFSRREVEELVKRSGLKLLEYRRYNFLPRNQIKRIFPNAVHSKYFIIIFEKLDSILSKFFPLICNQSYFCAEKI